jgi:hypothetical protein
MSRLRLEVDGSIRLRLPRYEGSWHPTLYLTNSHARLSLVGAHGLVLATATAPRSKVSLEPTALRIGNLTLCLAEDEIAYVAKALREGLRERNEVPHA